VKHWLAALEALNGAGTPAVLVTVASGKGSVPRESGAKMLVWDAGMAGTIGGGHLEFKAIEIARDLLASGGGTDLRRFPLGASLGQCCGGATSLLFEPIAPGAHWVQRVIELARVHVPHVVVTPERGQDKLVVTRDDAVGSLAPAADVLAVARRMVGAKHAVLETVGDARLLFDPSDPHDLEVVLFGAGHVGRALVQVLGGLPCTVTWVDGRDGQFPSAVPANVRIEATDTPVAVVGQAPVDAAFLVMTHSHALDFDLAEAILARGDFRYFGMIGSATKRRSFEQRMRARGVAQVALERMTCPIGVPGVVGKEPEVIAVAVAAQLMQLRDAVSVALPARTGGHVG
jgi:xanthine dehydrogenase accessory factor